MNWFIYLLILSLGTAFYKRKQNKKINKEIFIYKFKRKPLPMFTNKIKYTPDLYNPIYSNPINITYKFK